MPTAARVLAKSGVTPPKDVQAACRRGLDLAAEHGGPGLTDAAKDRARSMAEGKAVSPGTLKRIKAFHARHGSYEKTASPPSPGYVAFMVWGGAAGERWANSQVERLDKQARSESKAAIAKKADAKKTATQQVGDGLITKAAKKKADKKKGSKKNLIDGKGAWAAAQDRAKGKRNPEAYARRIYANMTKKTREVSDAACEVLKKFLCKQD